METFAVYWEPIIKTYGIAIRTGLCLVSLDLPGSGIRDGGDWLARMATQCEGSLVLIFSRPASPSGLRLNLLLDPSARGKERCVEKGATVEKNAPPEQAKGLNPAAFCGAGSGLQVDNSVELVYFQGPHYGDRYGIAGAALTALTDQGVPLLAAVCTGASVYLIFPKGMAGAARIALGKAFSIPETAPPTSA